jgi:type VI secretion system secreted protein VgrG
MAGDAHNGFQLTEIEVKVDGTSGSVNFSNLVITQELADVNDFSFCWRQEEGEASLAGHVEFYQKNLSKEVTISIGDDFIFKGLITSIHCFNQDSLGIEYEIKGQGLFARLNEVNECNSFYKKSLKQIFTDLNTAQGTKLKLSPKNTDDLFYTVQYNQPTFATYKMLAARYGEWLYYSGTELVMGAPEGDPVQLKTDVDVHELNITARITKVPSQAVGFDHYKGEAIESSKKAAKSGSGLVAASTDAGDNAFGDSQTNAHVSHAPTGDILSNFSILQQQAAAAAAVTINGQTRNSKIKLGGKIRIMDEKDKSAGDYIITKISHGALTNNNYENHFSAIPAEAEVPPYTDPLLFPISRSQAAIVVENEDKDGLDRIKVRFLWQKPSETSPWISVLTPHAGKDKGFRFLPEKDEEVLVSFVDNNAEKPFVNGAIFTEKNKSGVPHEGNNIKIIGSKSGRRLEIDDDQGVLKLVDNEFMKRPINGLLMTRTDSETQNELQSKKDQNNVSAVILNADKGVAIRVVSGGSEILEITMEPGAKKLRIVSKGSINIEAQDELNLSATTINIKATKEVKIDGKKDVAINGGSVDIEAGSTMNVKGITTTVEGSAKIDVKGGAMASLTAALVKIN